MRKYIRYGLRVAAEKAGVKPSRHVAYGWDEIQNHKVGWAVRQINKAKGTAPKHKWRQKIRAVIG